MRQGSIINGLPDEARRFEGVSEYPTLVQTHCAQMGHKICGHPPRAMAHFDLPSIPRRAPIRELPTIVLAAKVAGY